MTVTQNSIVQNIAKITLLTTDEAKTLPIEIRKYKDNGKRCWWWLRSPGFEQDCASCVGAGGAVHFEGPNVTLDDLGVRPALKITNLKSLNLQLYEHIRIFGLDWIVISEDTVLCSTIIGRTFFNKDGYSCNANNYEKSDIKKYLERWLEAKIRKANKNKIKDYSMIQKTAYEKYKLDWMLRHGYTLSDLWEIFTELAGEEIDDNPEDIPINSSETILFTDKLRNRFLTDVGFNGSVFACMEEFLDSEYSDSYYMSKLLTNTEWNKYIAEKNLT